MKKNLLSILILSLLVVNIVMTAIMLFSVIGTNKKTAAIVTDIAGKIRRRSDGRICRSRQERSDQCHFPVYRR